MNEKIKFSQRLIATLKRSGMRTVSPTKLAIDFNLTHRGKPVSTQAVHKWLNGTAIPAQDKIRTLSEWLNVSPEWLRYGGVEAESKLLRQDVPPYQTLEEQLLADFRLLSDGQKQVVRELAASLLRLRKDGC
ncbi:MAG: hypothetical protein WC023_04450 [Rhodocyclaceae bacterium]